MRATLRSAFSRNGSTAAIFDADLPDRGVRFEFEEVGGNIVNAYRRMARHGDLDLCEMAPVTYLAARAAGAPLVALPIFTFRRFHHADVICRVDSGMHGPESLAGRVVGVRAYSVTSAVWMRGIWQHEYGVELGSLNWVTDDEENLDTIVLPDSVRRLPANTSVREQFMQRQIAAAFTGPAGLGRVGPPSSAWEHDTLYDGSRVLESTRTLIADWREAQAQSYARTGILPLHGVLVLRTAVLDEHPDIGERILSKFTDAKNRYLQVLAETPEPQLSAEDRSLRAVMRIVGPDPLPYGFHANRASIESLIQFCAEQGLAEVDEPATSLFLDT